MNGHRDIWIRWPPTLQSHMIKGTISQNHVNAETSITGLYNYHHHHQSRRLTRIPHPSSQTYMSTMTNIAELCILQRGRKSQCMITWLPLSLLQTCGCHHRHCRVRWWPLSLRYVQPTTPSAELQDCQDQHCHSYVNITTTSQRYVNTITSNITKWSNYFNQSGKVVSITLKCVTTIPTTTAVMETSMPTTADMWIWHNHCRSASYYARHHRAIEDHFITL